MAGKITEMTVLSVPALEDLMEVVDDPAGSPLTRSLSLDRLGGLFAAQVCQGRLTTESGVPVSTSDRTSQGTLYWTPCTPDGVATASGLVGFFDGTRYVVRSVAQLSLDLSTAEAGGAIDSGENHDVFIDLNAGTPALVLGPGWTNDTTRATALAQQGSIIVLTGDTDWRWVGTIRASGSGVTEDSEANRFVWNAANAVDRTVYKRDTTDSWTSTDTAYHSANTSTANRINVLSGAVGSPVSLSFWSTGTDANGTTGVRNGIGEDSTSAAASGMTGGFIVKVGSGNGFSIMSTLTRCVPLGFHFYQMLESSGGGGGNTTYYGDGGDSATTFATVMSGTFRC